ncbi:MAG: hypothetical protein GXP48_08840 [Acidobacteria bacterium]|nr:hypothetical protein [Acidobacteriota bacterium]
MAPPSIVASSREPVLVVVTAQMSLSLSILTLMHDIGGLHRVEMSWLD